MIHNELLALIDQANCEGWKELDLSGKDITELPEKIGQLTMLRKLDLSANQLTSLPATIGQLTSLAILDLSWNGLTTIPPQVSQLACLEHLDLSVNPLKNIPTELKQLDKLTSLNLQRTFLTTIPSEVFQLLNLQHLKLGGNQLKRIPSEITQLTSLISLDFSSNQLVIIPLEFTELTQLLSLDLSQNWLTTLPQRIAQFTKLETLTLFANWLVAIPSEIGQLTQLKELNLNANKLTTVPSAIGQLTNLETLHLTSNQLANLPPQIGQLTNLKNLYLDNNQLEILPQEIGQLKHLQELGLSSNQLTILPSTLRSLVKLEKLRLHTNPLPFPPEFLGDWGNLINTQVILNTYFQASQPLREAKLLFVGEGSVGKTSLVERLLHNRPPSDRGKTIGVDIHRWQVASEQWAETDASGNDLSSLQVNVWDFGGQEILHTTHQFFLTHRSLYLVVIEARKDEASNRLTYWLRHVQSFAGDAPIILIVNKSDQGRLGLDERDLMLRYPTIRAIIHTSCTTGTGIAELRQTVEESLATLTHINDWVPLTWFTVKEKLAGMGKDLLPYENYQDLCEKEGITHEAAQQTLARFLHDLGAALNFHDTRQLAGTYILNPEWVTNGIYAILNDPALQEQGILRLDDLDAILDRRYYPPHKHPFLLDIMGKFELAAPLLDGESYLIPGLLPKERPTFNWPADALATLEYRYAILPASILSRLMVRLHHHTWQGELGQPVRWRNGLGVTRDGCRALIVANPEAARLTIALDGPIPYRRHLLAVIRAELDGIHASFAKLEAKEFVPIPGYSPEKAIAYEDLLYYESEQDWTPRYAPIKARIDVRVLLDGIESLEDQDIRALVNKLQQYFNKAELRQLAFEVLVDHEDLPSETKTDLARELALKCRRQGRLAELEEQMRREISKNRKSV